MTVVNFVPTKTDKVRAVCEFCDRRSAPVKPIRGDAPGILDIPVGWSSAPYPEDFVHVDGSVGSTYACPKCNKKLNAGESLKVHESRRAAYVRQVIPEQKK